MPGFGQRWMPGARSSLENAVLVKMWPFPKLQRELLTMPSSSALKLLQRPQGDAR